MNLSQLEQKLIAAARLNPPGEEVPYAFETRVMARLKSLPQADEWLWWSRALWRGAAVCVSVALLCGVWSFFPLHSSRSPNGGADLEEAVLATVREAEATW